MNRSTVDDCGAETGLGTGPVGWRLAGPLIAGAVLLVAVVYHGVLGDMIRTWMGSKTYNHAFLIFPISAYLAWEKRHLVKAVWPRPYWWGLVAIAIAAAAWVIGQISLVLAIQEFALIMMVQALVITVLGVRAGTILAFALFYLLFAVPFGEFLIEPLQDFTAGFLVQSLRILNIPVFHDGVFISIPTGNFEVAAACAGLRFLIATIALGFLFAHLSFKSHARQAAFIGLCMIVPIIANGFRALGIVLLAYYSNNKIAVGVDHIVYGWGFFAFVTILLLYFGSRFADKPLIAGASADGVAGDMAGTPAAPRELVLAAALSLALIGGAPLVAAWIKGPPPAPLTAPMPLPAITGPWTLAEGAPDSWRPMFKGVDGERLEVFTDGGQPVIYYTGIYLAQSQGRELISQSNSFQPDKDWSRAGGGSALISVDGRMARAAYVRLLGLGQQRLVVYWYWVDGQFTADPRLAKLLHAKSVLSGGERAAAVIAVAADYHTLPREAIERIQDFLKQTTGIGDSLRQALATARRR